MAYETMGSNGAKGAGAPAAAAGTQPGWRASLTIPPLESPFMEVMLADSGLSADNQQLVRHLARDGYVVFRPDIPGFDDTAERIKRDLKGKSDIHRRVSEGWYWNEDVRALACAPHLVSLLSLLYQREAFPFQTLNFEVGSEQPAHSDTIHFHSLPRHYMCGVWLALEDIHPDAGPLVVYPGSHKLPDYDMQDLGVTPHPDQYQQYEDFVREMLRARGLTPQPLLLKKGEAAIWTANLYHGGSAIRDPARTRYSQATHYYFANCQYFFPMQSDLPAQKITRREVIDLRTGRWVQHFHNGQPVDLGDLRNVCTYPRPLPSFVK